MIARTTADGAPTARRPDILTWLPQRWDQFVGNRLIIRRFKQMVRQLRQVIEEGTTADLNRLRFLLFGLSRSGKTALVTFLVRCLTCRDLDLVTLNPCARTCDTCKHRVELCGIEGLHSDLVERGEGMSVHFSIVDCTLIDKPDDLRRTLRNMSQYNGLRIIYFDEVHRLANRGMEEMLLKATETWSYVWLFSTAKPDNLEDMFVNRLLKMETTLPQREEMEDWLIERCGEFSLAWEPEAIVRVVEKCNLVAGTALHALAEATLNPDGLTVELVEEWKVRLKD